MEPRLQGFIQSKLLFKGLILFFIIGMCSCEDDNKIGLEITPPGERFAYHTDNSSVIKVSSLRQDSLTSEKRERSLLGSMNDPVFGNTNAGILAQLRLSTNDVDFGEEVQLDSAVILLKYEGGYGDTTDMQHIRVYELTEDLYYDSTYYSNIDLSSYYSDNELIADMQFSPTPSADSLLIRVDDRIGDKILFADESHLLDNTSFLEYFKGIYIEPVATMEEGSITYFDLSGGYSRMTVYYHNASEDSLKYEVVINSNCTWINTFDHEYQGSQAESLINDSTANFENIYMQSMAGLRAHARIEFSDTLLQLSDIGVAVNKAELIIPVATEYIMDNKPVPGNIQVYNALEDGTNEFINDVFLGEDYYGGYYREDTGEYIFNIARYVQNLLDPLSDFRLKNTGLFIVVSDARTAANQVVLKNNPLGEQFRLNITYTVFN